jgi:hypothetical protein
MPPDEKKPAAPDEKKPAAPAVALSYPAPLSEIKTHPRHAAFREVVRNWVEQKKTINMQFCADEKCYYPLRVKRAEETNFEELFAQDADGRRYTIGECSWDPRHCGGQQPIYPPPELTPGEDLNPKGR